MGWLLLPSSLLRRCFTLHFLTVENDGLPIFSVTCWVRNCSPLYNFLTIHFLSLPFPSLLYYLFSVRWNNWKHVEIICILSLKYVYSVLHFKCYFFEKEIEDVTILLVSSCNDYAAFLCSFLSRSIPPCGTASITLTRPVDSGNRGPGSPLKYCVPHIEFLVCQSTIYANFSPFNLSSLNFSWQHFFIVFSIQILCILIKCLT